MNLFLANMKKYPQPQFTAKIWKKTLFGCYFGQSALLNTRYFFSSVKFKSFAPGASLTQKIREKQCKEQNATNCTVLFITLHTISFHKFFCNYSQNRLWKLRMWILNKLIKERNFELPKGQLISKGLFDVIVLTKKPTNFFNDFCRSL